MKYGLGAAILLLATTVAAESIEQLEITHDGARYRLALSARLDAPAAASYRSFSDFSLLPQINNAVEKVSILPGAAAGATRVQTTVRVCVSFFCRRLQQVQDIRPLPGPQTMGLEAVVLPALSNLRYGHAIWQMSECGTQTCLKFNAELEPDFWVPPLIGPWAIERAMRREAVQTAQGIERLANSVTP